MNNMDEAVTGACNDLLNTTSNSPITCKNVSSSKKDCDRDDHLCCNEVKNPDVLFDRIEDEMIETAQATLSPPPPVIKEIKNALKGTPGEDCRKAGKVVNDKLKHCCPDSKKKGLSTGAIIGIVAGSVGGVLVLALVIWYVSKGGRNRGMQRLN